MHYYDLNCRLESAYPLNELELEWLRGRIRHEVDYIGDDRGGEAPDVYGGPVETDADGVPIAPALPRWRRWLLRLAARIEDVALTGSLR